MIRSLPRALQWWISSNTILTRHTNIGSTFICISSNRKLQVTRTNNLQAIRYISTGQSLCKDTKEYADDPEVKEWMKELRKDFSKDLSNHPEKESGEGKEVQGETDEGANSSSSSSSSSDEEETKEESKEAAKRNIKAWSQVLGGKYQKLDTHSQIIYDYDEERLRKEQGLEDEVEEEEEVEKIKLERGETGVFDIEELVELLREENAQDIVVIRIPVELKYADYMVIVSSSSQRHRTALGQLVRKAYKLKKNSKDLPLMPEGTKTHWVAMDLGSIILHIMDPETREYYDLETLWTVGPAFDEKAQVSEEDLVGIRRPIDPLAAPPPTSPPAYPSPQPVT